MRIFQTCITIYPEGILEINIEHLTEDDLEDYFRNVLPEESVARVETHLLTCQICRKKLSATEEYLKAMKAATQGLAREDRARSRTSWSLPRWFIPVFAAIAVTAVVAVCLPMFRQTSLHPSSGAPFAVSLATTRGVANQAAAPADRPLDLQLDLTGLAESPSYQVEMVDQSGNRVWQGVSKGNSAAVPAQKAGTYFVRVALPSGQMLREYGLLIQAGK